ncbi:MAG: anhydro-N-acetylmuramic acid kinase [Bacteroidetes bacterium]|nr:anhydro-N-acetylmuramic acid kinase [Bacteroidota bacterium]
MAGCMSGTSLDGVDVALVRISGSGRGVRLMPLESASYPYSEDLKARILAVADPSAPGALTTAAALAALNAELAGVYAAAIRRAVDSAGRSLAELDLAGCHGQTVFHDPSAGVTLQLGDPARMAQILGVTVVGDFRQGDMALGGEGAPLVPYMDWVLFAHDTEHRLLLNLGGIANVTSLPPGCDRDAVLAFDTGPANMLLDGLAQRLAGEPMDRDGALALAGHADVQVVEELMRHPYFHRQPPKSTGRELFSAAYLDDFLGRTAHLNVEDRMATAAALTVESVARAVRDFLPGSPERMWVSGGGVHNLAVMQGLASALGGLVVEPLSAAGYDPDAKEALCFALLAHEALNGVATGMPSVTGASGRAFSGKICPAGTPAAH